MAMMDWIFFFQCYAPTLFFVMHTCYTSHTCFPSRHSVWQRRITYVAVRLRL